MGAEDGDEDNEEGEQSGGIEEGEAEEGGDSPKNPLRSHRGGVGLRGEGVDGESWGGGGGGSVGMGGSANDGGVRRRKRDANGGSLVWYTLQT